MISLTQLEYALALDQFRHFGQAAQFCHVTQPTLSQQLQKLEDELGLILFDRNKKPILPTPEGQRFLDQAKVVIREHHKLIQISKQDRAGDVSGEFKLAVIPTVASYFLPWFIRPFSKAFPKVRLLIEETKTETILSELQEDRLDGAILATPISGVDFKVHPLYYEPFYLYFSLGHPLLKKTTISRSDLNFSEMWLLQDGHCFKDQVLNYCSFPKTATSQISFQSGSLDTLRRLIQSNQGFTMVPALMVDSLRKTERDAHLRSFKNPVPTREISMIYRRDHWKLQIIQAIESVVRQNLPASVQEKPLASQTVLEVS